MASRPLRPCRRGRLRGVTSWADLEGDVAEPARQPAGSVAAPRSAPCRTPPNRSRCRWGPTSTTSSAVLAGCLPHVGIVVRDRRARPQPERYNVCYVNGFQTQADERRFWRHRMWLVLHKNGKPVVDEAWNEWLLDVRTPAKRQRLAQIVGCWTQRCCRRRLRRRGVRQPRLVHPQPRSAAAQQALWPTRGCWSARRTAPGWPLVRRTWPASTAARSATTSQSRRSADGGVSAAATSPTSAGGCW